MRTSWVLGLIAICFGGGLQAAKLPKYRFHSHEDAERRYESPAAKLATGAVPRLAKYSAPYDWPVKVLSIGHTNASYQNYGLSPSDAYFHHGIDIRADAGSDVVASAGGKVVNIENYMTGELYWEVAVLDDEGYLWQYHHVDYDSIPQAIHDAYKNGSKIKAGTKLGEVVYWPQVSFNERYHHVHLNVLGQGKKYLDPFSFLKPLDDKDEPTIDGIYLVQKGKKLNSTRVTGNYTIAAEVSDLILHNKYKVPPHMIYYQMDRQMPVLVWSFDTLPGGASNTQYVNDFFILNTCGDYSCRRGVVDLGFQRNPAQVFPTAAGSYSMTVRVVDYAGNTAEQSYSWTVY